MADVGRPGLKMVDGGASQIIRDYFANSNVVEALRGVSLLAKSCYGPRSRLKLLQNVSGGHVTMTSLSGRLLNLIYAEEPVVKVILTAVKKHVQLNVDGGLFCLGLTSSLIHDSLLLDQNRILTSKIYHNLHQILEEYYQSETVEGVRKLDWSSLKDSMALTESIMRPKSGCILDDCGRKYVCKVLVEAFVRSFSPESSNSISDIQTISVIGSSPTETRYLEGILLRADPDPQMATTTLRLPDKIMRQNGVKKVKFVVVTTSMAGDYGDDKDDDVAYVGKRDVVMDDVIEPALYRRMVELCNGWIADGVGMVLCQKVVHWTVVRYLKEHDVLVLQRLGLQTSQYVLRITGGAKVGSILQSPSEDVYGCLRSVQLVEYCDKTYYQLSVLDSAVCSTLLVVNGTEESLAELQCVCRSALDSLRLAARHPRLVLGGGHFENHGAQYLRQQVRLRHLRLMQAYQCTRVQLYTITEQFCRTLQSTTSQFDQNDEFRHSSNLVEDFIRLSLNRSENESSRSGNESESVDLLCIKLAALHSAVFTACGLIQVDALFETRNS